MLVHHKNVGYNLPIQNNKGINVKKVLTLCLAGLMSMTLVGCDAFTGKVVKEEGRDYEIIHVKRPKHFKVDLRDVKTGEVFNSVYVQKTCPSWRRLKVGSVWTFKYTEKRRDSGMIVQDVNVNIDGKTGQHRSLCSRLR